MINPPAGFRAVRLPDGGQLILAEELDQPAWRAALEQPERWLHVARGGAGRGPRGALQLENGPRLAIKQCLRGGWPARFNRTRYFRLGRFARELHAGRAARAAGLPVAETLAIRTRPAAPGWFVWSASRWLAGMTDLAALWRDPRAQGQRELLWAGAEALLSRLADQGLVHPDLNLGNLMHAPDDARNPIWLIDLDRACWLGRPLASADRTRACARLRRSRTKLESRAVPS